MTDPPPIDTHPSTFAALRDPTFSRYALGYVPSMTGMWLRITAFGYLVYDLTEDPLALGVLGIASSVPLLVLSPISGAFIDRLDRRLVLVTAQLLMIAVTAATALLVATDRMTYPLLLGISVLLGALVTFDWPVRLALIPSLVDRSLLQNAIALNTTMFNVSRVFGPALAGWLIALVGTAWAFGMTALLMLPFPFVLLGLARLKQLPRTKPTGSGLAQLRDGYHYIARDPAIAAIMLMNAGPILLGFSYVTMAPAYVSDVLRMDATALGYLMAINGIGSVVGTVLVARFQRLRGRGVILLRTLAVFAVLLVAFGVTSNVLVAFMAVFLLGATFGFATALNDTLIQLQVEEAYRGRVMSVYAMILALSPIGALLVGGLATLVGIQASLAAIGVVVLASVPLLWRRTALASLD